MIALDFNYGELFKLLKKRGEAMRRMQITKKELIESKIE